VRTHIKKGALEQWFAEWPTRNPDRMSHTISDLRARGLVSPRRTRKYGRIDLPLPPLPKKAAKIAGPLNKMIDDKLEEERVYTLAPAPDPLPPPPPPEQLWLWRQMEHAQAYRESLQKKVQEETK